MELWFADQPIVVKVLVVLLSLPVFFFFMGLFAFLGMGTGSSEFPENPTLRDVFFHIIFTTILGFVVTAAAAILFGLIQLALWFLALLKQWTGG